MIMLRYRAIQIVPLVVDYVKLCGINNMYEVLIVVYSAHYSQSTKIGQLLVIVAPIFP